MASSAPMSSVAESRADRVRTDRIPPYSEEAERGVLGASLLDAERVLDLCLSRGIGVDAFYLRPHQVLFEALLAMHQASKHIDLLTASQKLKDLGVMEAVGGAAYLDQLVDATPTPAHAEYYIDILHQKYLFRAMIQRSRETIDACYSAEDDAEEILGRAEQGMFDISDLERHTARGWQDMVKVTMEEIETVFQSKKGLTGLPSGFQDFDRMLMGLQPGDMLILAARPSMGKTSLAMNIVEHVATGYAACSAGYRDQEAAPVGVFSLEMSGEQLVRRMICCCARIPSHKLAGGYISKDNHTALIHSADLLTKAKIVLDDTPGLSVLDLRARARRMARKFGIRMLVVDYLQLLNYPQYARENRQRETAAISGALKAMAKELRIPVLVLSQLSRAPETRDRLAVPKLSDLRDSGSIEQDADVVLLLRRPCKYPDDPEAEDRTLAIVEVAKHRNGPTGEVRLNFTEDFTRFTDRARADHRGGDDPSEAEEGFEI